MVKIHFLNVGHGDCTIIEHASGNLTMLDINNADQLDDDSRKELAEAYGIQATRIHNHAELSAGIERTLASPVPITTPICLPADCSTQVSVQLTCNRRVTTLN